MKKIIIFIFPLIIFFLMISGCKKSRTITAADTSSNSNIYTAGNYANGVAGIPCYWQGTSKTDLPASSGGGNALSIYVSSGTVYTAGAYFDSSNNTIACYWSGTVKTDLPGNTNGATANSIFVSSGTIYTAGWYSTGPITIPCYWTGTTKTDLPGGSGGGYAASTYISGGTVYTAGWYNNPSAIACYWTGTTKTDLSAGILAGWAYSIFVSGGTVYTSGSYYNGYCVYPVLLDRNHKNGSSWYYKWHISNFNICIRRYSIYCRYVHR